MPLNTTLILSALLAQVILTIVVYAVLVRARYAAARRGEVTVSQYVVVRDEPEYLGRITRNVANQFELPVLFYALVLMLVAVNRVTMFDVIVAWAFVAVRVVHAAVHIRTSDVMLRLRVFGVGLVLIGLLTAHGVLIVLGSLAR
ncbi:hypothetical protein EDC22_11520 [Tepidamorphus gemmatus]|jgi:hypothetical protein|uniref:MAPEG family protein n=1 Tax=Tepidamorphus gemmatus TaxID=747076 RepID=A0A4R3LV91_9HYPH|nr:MAPEG family protein [Tepidamorphus gemmatus]TCT04540.1 hypothetical protein EDC22_11520 [Tepidamorphus gemmatus]